jgi:FtsP/CotA-like multicopper oxidase with cupredoxin domain
VGDVSKIRIFNVPKSFHPMNHPIHIHGQRYLVLSMDGVSNRNQVWKDTAIVPVGSTMDILVDMSNPGTWMLHCHISEHLQSGMMLTFTVAE